RLLLTNSSAYVPDGAGPPESTRTDGNSNILPAPTGLGAQGGDAQVALAWNAVAGSSGYKLYRSTTNPVVVTSGNLLNGGNPALSTSFIDQTVANDITYYYVVTAINSAGIESPPSNQASVTPASGML